MWRRNNPDMHDASDEQNDPPKRRRDGRGLGPFTSGHLTIITVTLLILVAFPFAAFAVTGNNVFVTDATSGNRATVAGGKLNVETGISHPFGLVPVAPVAPEIYPTGDIVHTDNGSGRDFVLADNCGAGAGTCQTLLKPPAGKAAVVTTIHVAPYMTTSGAELDILRSSNGTCTSASLDRINEVVFPSGTSVTNLQYDLPGGLAVPAGKALCAYNVNTNSLGVEVSARGYAVASNVVPANAPAAGAPEGAALLKPQR